MTYKEAWETLRREIGQANVHKNAFLLLPEDFKDEATYHRALEGTKVLTMLEDVMDKMNPRKVGRVIKKP